jgi:hypothetical protein
LAGGAPPRRHYRDDSGPQLGQFGPHSWSARGPAARLDWPAPGCIYFRRGALQETPGSGQDRRPLPHPSTQLRQAASCVVVRRRASSSWLSSTYYVRLHQVPDKCQRPSSDRQRCPARRVNVTGCASVVFQARLHYPLPADDASILLCACRGPAQTPESLALSPQSSVRATQCGVLPGPARPCSSPCTHSLVCNCIRPAICSLGRLPRIPSRCFHPWLHAL